MNRREFLTGALAAAAAGCQSTVSTAARPDKVEWVAFSRVFQRFGLERAATLLGAAGYTGVEWTVRKGGFVEPATARRDLPRALEVARAHGLSHETIIVDFLDPFEGNNLDTLKAAADGGVRNFRPAYFTYDFRETAAQSLERIRRGFDRLDKAARETGVRCLYQNHSTYSRKVPLFGSVVWDLWDVMRHYDPRYMGVQYDYMHARAETGPSWQRGLSLLGPWIGTQCLKDFRFAMDPKRPGDWMRVLVPAGQGMLDWREYRDICRRENIVSTYAVHYDYAFPETDYDRALKCAREDLAFYRKALA